MRTVSTITLMLVLLMLVATNAVAQAPANMLEGSWKMISQQSVYPDTIIVSQNVPPSTKILNSTHFAWGFMSEDGEEVLAGGGRYELLGDSLYIEYLEYHTSPPLVGLAIKFKAKVVGDSLWYHTGVFPSGYRLEEVWRRVE